MFSCSTSREGEGKRVTVTEYEEDDGTFRVTVTEYPIENYYASYWVETHCYCGGSFRLSHSSGSVYDTDPETGRLSSPPRERSVATASTCGTCKSCKKMYTIDRRLYRAGIEVVTEKTVHWDNLEPRLFWEPSRGEA